MKIVTGRFNGEIPLLARTSVIVLSILFGGVAVHAQLAATPAVGNEFSVASVRPGDPSAGRGSVEYQPEAGRFTSNSATLDQLIGFAYDIRPHQIIGGPGWRGSAGFTIEAKADRPLPSGPVGTQMFRTMLQKLLIERFKLIAHEEMRETTVYELGIAKDGSKLKEDTKEVGGVRMASGEFVGTAAPMFLLVNQLSRQLGRTVVDKTGLTGKYDFSLKWQPDPGLSGPDASSQGSGPSIFTAVQEDLGLRLQSAKAQVKFIVIDRLEKPDAN